jgi:hypothetical protein
MADKAKKKWNPGCVMIVIGGALFISPIPLTYLICLPVGNPGGCGDIVLAFIPLMLLGPILALIGLVVAVVVAKRNPAPDVAETKPVLDHKKCSLCDAENPVTEMRCTSCGTLLPQS